mmetsp:Transcript_49565/g.160173  ORF Transcript_49565/g.160173 Transcript_49565/m.160173 type:complete len:337 (+) Transcript_49565:1505-2515(+)
MIVGSLKFEAQRRQEAGRTPVGLGRRQGLRGHEVEWAYGHAVQLDARGAGSGAEQRALDGPSLVWHLLSVDGHPHCAILGLRLLFLVVAGFLSRDVVDPHRASHADVDGRWLEGTIVFEDLDLIVGQQVLRNRLHLHAEGTAVDLAGDLQPALLVEGPAPLFVDFDRRAAEGTRAARRAEAEEEGRPRARFQVAHDLRARDQALQFTTSEIASPLFQGRRCSCSPRGACGWHDNQLDLGQQALLLLAVVLGVHGHRSAQVEGPHREAAQGNRVVLCTFTTDDALDGLGLGRDLVLVDCNEDHAHGRRMGLHALLQLFLVLLTFRITGRHTIDPEQA